MKLLVIGIDGADERIISALIPNQFKTLKDSMYNKVLTEDLWSRGWAHIFTGKKACDTGAAYTKPLLDGTYDFTQNFGLKDLEENDDVTPIWKLVNNSGGSVGIMNVPGTSPAPNVNGFFISGAGAGLGKIKGIPEHLCSPRSIKPLLDSYGYILDTRFVASGIRDKELLFYRLSKMICKREESYLKLCKKYKPDFGFIVFSATTRAQYLTMSEIENGINSRNKSNHNNNASDYSYWSYNKKLFDTLFNSMVSIINKLSPNNLIITADHGAVPYRYSANVDPFLTDKGLLKINTNSTFIRDIIKPMIPSNIKAYISKFSGIKRSGILTKFNSKRTLAFGNRHIPGIYINDERFNGPVRGIEKRTALITEICSAFNKNPIAIKFNMESVPYRQEYQDRRHEMILPDIWINKPDDIFFEGKGDFVQQNPDYGPIGDLDSIEKDMFTGIKGRHPLFICNKELESRINNDDHNDLRLVYQLIDRIYNN